jgi:hypothetical protein
MYMYRCCWYISYIQAISIILAYTKLCISRKVPSVGRSAKSSEHTSSLKDTKNFNVIDYQKQKRWLLSSNVSVEHSFDDFL